MICNGQIMLQVQSPSQVHSGPLFFFVIGIFKHLWKSLWMKIFAKSDDTHHWNMFMQNTLPSANIHSCFLWMCLHTWDYGLMNVYTTWFQTEWHSPDAAVDYKRSSKLLGQYLLHWTWSLYNLNNLVINANGKLK